MKKNAQLSFQFPTNPHLWPYEQTPSPKKMKPQLGRKKIRPDNVFGGKYFKNYNPSVERPIEPNKALHLVLRSSRAKGRYSFKNPLFEEKIWDIIRKHAQNQDIKIYEYANASNHLHLLIRVKERLNYHRFIRTITGLIARLVSGIEKGKKMKGRFWDMRPFSRVVSFANKEFHNVKTYLLRNTLEAIGIMPYFPRHKKLPEPWRTFWRNLLTPI